MSSSTEYKKGRSRKEGALPSASPERCLPPTWGCCLQATPQATSSNGKPQAANEATHGAGTYCSLQKIQHNFYDNGGR